jgi:hypothetical protein
LVGRDLKVIDLVKLGELLETSKVSQCLLGDNLENEQWTISSQVFLRLSLGGFVVSLMVKVV